MVLRTGHAVFLLCREGNKKGVFALKNVGVVDFVVWIFFCNFVNCVWWIACDE